ncbi:MAG: hypothetical protein ACNA8W_07420 [Bradymonadaceae bacterium]
MSTTNLTPALKAASVRKAKFPGWDGWDAYRLADKLKGVVPGLRMFGDPNGNWFTVHDEDQVVRALVYSEAPLVLAEPAFAVAARAELSNVEVVPHLTAYDEDIFSLEVDESEGLLPYPADEIDLNFSAFAPSDFVYETM